jgi:hypothetical protein
MDGSEDDYGYNYHGYYCINLIMLLITLWMLVYEWYSL